MAETIGSKLNISKEQVSHSHHGVANAAYVQQLLDQFDLDL